MVLIINAYLNRSTTVAHHTNGLLEWDSATTWAHRWGQWVPRNASNALTLTRTAGTNMALCVGNGIEVMSVDYRQMQSGLSGSIPATWVPFRFPGQVYDAETDMFENFNRDYFPDLGTYLSSEPLLQDPSFPAYRAGRSLSTPTYAYASNNPVGRVDRDGRGDGTTADDWWFGPLAVPGVAPYAAGAVAVGVVGAATVGTIAVGIDQFPDPGAGTVEPPGGWPQPAGPSVGVGTAAAAAAVAGAAIICQMAKGGKQNLANEWSRRAQQEPDPCKWLRAMYAVADASDRMKIKIAEKFLGCRGSSGGGP